jgi:hypothetical protein
MGTCDGSNNENENEETATATTTTRGGITQQQQKGMWALENIFL